MPHVAVLGVVGLHRDGAAVAAGPPRQQTILAVLALDAGRPVPVPVLIDRLWGAEPQPAARSTLYAHLSRLRQAVAAAGLDDHVRLVSSPAGYRLDVDPDQVDAHRFRRLVRAAATAPDDQRADLLDQAMALWRGSALAGLRGEWADRTQALLERERLDATVLWAQAQLRVGRPGVVAGALRELVQEHPLVEPLAARLIEALAREGRTAEALECYAGTRQHLVEELGAEPGPDLRRVHQAVLTGELDQPAGDAPSGRPPAPWPAPNQLPAAARYFTGRERVLARLVRRPEDGSGGGTVVVTAVGGMAGIGKTAVAVRAAHQLTATGRYPDGTLFIDLRGYSGPAPTPPEDALDTLLRGLGVSGPQLPPGIDAKVALYRARTAPARALFVLDNAHDEAQVRPLLPAGAGCLVIVTSRRRLAGLDEADHVALDTLPLPDAVRLFGAVAGPAAGGARPAVEEIVTRCGLLPLAIRVAAARLKTSPDLDPDTLLAQLRAAYEPPAQDLPEALDDGERSVFAALEASYRHLPGEQQHAFAVLALHPGPDLDRYAAAALLGTGAAPAGRLLADLERVNLLQHPRRDRYRFHDLTRLYAGRHAPAPAQAEPALDRLREMYARATAAAVRAAYPSDTIRHPAPTTDPGLPLPTLADRAAALAWLDAELPNLLGTALHAAEHRPAAHLTHQSAALHTHLSTRGLYGTARTLHQAAVDRARALGDRPGELGATIDLGRTQHVLGRYDEAAQSHTHALELALASGDVAGEVRALTGIGWAHSVHGERGPAAACFGRAVELARASGDMTAELTAVTALGHVHRDQGRLDRAAECYTDGLRLARATGTAIGEINALAGLGDVEMTRCRYGPAADHYALAGELARASGDPGHEIDPQIGLGWASYLRGRPGAAAAAFSRALELARGTGEPAGDLMALTGLGTTSLAQGRHDTARDCFEQVLVLAGSMATPNWECEAYLGLGRVHHATGEPGRALDTYQRALAIAVELDQPSDQVRALDGIAHAHDALAHPGPARHHWQRALDLLTTLGIPAAADVTADDLRAKVGVASPA